MGWIDPLSISIFLSCVEIHALFYVRSFGPNVFQPIWKADTQHRIYVDNDSFICHNFQHQWKIIHSFMRLFGCNYSVWRLLSFSLYLWKGQYVCSFYAICGYKDSINLSPSLFYFGRSRRFQRFCHRGIEKRRMVKRDDRFHASLFRGDRHVFIYRKIFRSYSFPTAPFDVRIVVI